jgi:excisionase family DNA binding protein
MAGGISNVLTTHTDSPVFEPRLGRSVSIDRAAELLNVSRRTIYNRIRDGRLTTIRTRCGSQRVLLESMHGLGFSPFSTTPTAAVLDVRPVRS